MGVAIACEKIVHVTLPCQTRRAALEHLPDGDLRDTPLGDQFWAACEVYFATGRDTFGELPIALPPADAFAGKVYRVLRAIPAGETMTYGEIATRIGQPTAARAVAGAMGQNPTPLILPCHRVVGANALGGFSAPGGVDTKKRFLALEKTV
jgi:O-6-methylguanine DNA methyltransferase